MDFKKTNNANGWKVFDDNNNLIFSVVEIFTPQQILFDELSKSNFTAPAWYQYHVFDASGNEIDVYQDSNGAAYDPFGNGFTVSQNNSYSWANILANGPNMQPKELDKLNSIKTIMQQTGLAYHIASTLWVDSNPTVETFNEPIILPPPPTDEIIFTEPEKVYYQPSDIVQPREINPPAEIETPLVYVVPPVEDVFIPARPIVAPGDPNEQFIQEQNEGIFMEAPIDTAYGGSAPIIAPGDPTLDQVVDHWAGPPEGQDTLFDPIPPGDVTDWDVRDTKVSDNNNNGGGQGDQNNNTQAPVTIGGIKLDKKTLLIGALLLIVFMSKK